jgi:TolB-like protein/DNA-binding winged helix-turn-helix (wHTH) protein/Tfp pilus assembly protein PilF
MDTSVHPQTYCFRDFELDLGAHQLRLRGLPVRLERRPFELLALLVARQGLLVTRQEIISALWPANVVIDFDTGLNTLVRKVRHALGDSPDAPAFIETVTGVGYRFIAPLDEAAGSVPNAPQPSRAPDPQPARRVVVRSGRAAIAAGLLLAAAVVVSGVWMAADRGPSPISIAVLPYENLSRDHSLDYLAAGLAEDTSASLARIDLQNLRIMGRASVLAVAASDRTTAEIGRELGVGYVVASSLRAEGSKIRVTSRLLRVADNVEVWTATFDRELTSVLGLQRELSIAIAEQVRMRLSPEVWEAVVRRQTRNPEAYDLYLRGLYSWSLIDPSGIRRALEYYERAIEKDPAYALAWAGIAHALSTAPIIAEAEPAVVATRARVAKQRALEFGADLAEVQIALGYYHFLLDWDWPAAEAAFRQATTLDPNSAIAHLMLGHVRAQSGDHVESRMMARRARELDPFLAHTFTLSATMAFQARDYPSALEFARQAVAINPYGWAGHLNLAQVLAEIGEYPEALASYENAERYSGANAKAVAYRGHVLARMGRADEARAIASALEARSRERYVPPYTIAMIHAGLGEADTAFEWLDRALEARDIHLVFTTVDPRWDELRDDPRFRSLLSRCGHFGLDPPGRVVH